ncbi:MAG: superinfection exclusion B family protein [Chloroflexi bacterium]|nr:superinfection exclusion B family protein [Chloroflexota bacterium]
MDIGKIIEWLKLSTQQLLWLLLFSSIVLGLLIFASDSALAALGLSGLRADYRTLIGLLGILSFSGLIVTVGKSASQFAKSEIVQRQNLKRRQERLRNLTPPERTILRKYIEENTRTQYLSINDGVVQGLIAETILYQSSRVSVWELAFAHNVQPWAWDYLNRHPELVKETKESRAYHPC